MITIILGIIVSGIVILISGYNPLSGIYYLFAGGFKSLTRFCNTLAFATPMILAGLSFAFAFRSGLFNIGMPGQMLMGGCISLIFAVTFPDIPKPLMIPLIILVSMVAGGVWGAVPGFMKVKFNVSEVVTTIMMNWIAYWYVYYTVLLFGGKEIICEINRRADENYQSDQEKQFKNHLFFIVPPVRNIGNIEIVKKALNCGSFFCVLHFLTSPIVFNSKLNSSFTAASLT